MQCIWQASTTANLCVYRDEVLSDLVYEMPRRWATCFPDQLNQELDCKETVPRLTGKVVALH
jgi:hypothetical protein